MDKSPTSQAVLKKLRELESSGSKIKTPYDLMRGPMYRRTVSDQQYKDACPTLISDGMYTVTKTDNVLDAESWGIWLVQIEDGSVKVIGTFNESDRVAYAEPSGEAWKLLRSMCYDCTGQHPEQYVDIYLESQ